MLCQELPGELAVDLFKSACKSIETIYGGSEVTDCNVDYDALKS